MSVNVRRYLQDDGALVLADARELPCMRAEDRAFGIKATEVVNQMTDVPQVVNEGDTRKDVRFLAGFLAGLRWRADLLESAARHHPSSSEGEQ